MLGTTGNVCLQTTKPTGIHRVMTTIEERRVTVLARHQSGIETKALNSRGRTFCLLRPSGQGGQAVSVTHHTQAYPGTSQNTGSLGDGPDACVPLPPSVSPARAGYVSAPGCLCRVFITLTAHPPDRLTMICSKKRNEFPGKST